MRFPPWRMDDARTCAELAALRSLDLFKKLRYKGDNLWRDRSVAHRGVQAKLWLRGNLLPVMWIAGARSGWAEQDRICPFCDAREVETVEHMLSSCSFHDSLRQQCRREMEPWVDAANPYDFTRAVLGPTLDPECDAHVLRFLERVTRRRRTIWRQVCGAGDEFRVPLV